MVHIQRIGTHNGNISAPDHKQNLFQVYKQWKEISEQLSSTVNDYAGACSRLATVASTADRSTIETVFTSVDQGLHYLGANEEKLTAAKQLLSALRNRVSTLCPIDILPDEILGYVFELASVPCVQSNRNEQAQCHIVICPELLSSVCIRWRHVASNTYNLWTHLDLIPTAQSSHKLYNRSRIWLRKARSAPLHVHIRQRSCAKKDEIIQVTGFLAPIMRQLHTIHLEADCHTMELFQAVLGCWIEFGQPGSTKSLILHRPGPSSLMSHPGIRSPDEQLLDHLQTQHPDEHLDRFLLPLRTIRLHNVYIGWGTAALCRLSELHLEALPAWVGLTISQLILTLRASPEIRSLKIARVGIVDALTEGEDPSQPIYLGNLECLGLLGADFEVLKRLLTLVVPGKSPLSISMNLYEQDRILPELQSFLDRSSVSALYLDAGEQNWVPALFGCMPCLRSLAIRGFHLSRDSFPDSPPEQLTAICAPNLESLYFIGCRVGIKPLRGMVAAHSGTLRSLKLWRTNLYADSLSDVPDTDTGDVLDTLTDLIPHVQRSCQMNDYPVLNWDVCDRFRGCNVITPYD
ncbi:F-box-like protein [Rhizoctonia solani]|uniref:F-box-like protein n=1 Tax=Rhizoctonia solani TaxID=456999 RepID=A0A8H8NUR0_9AGAM|nr:F-box-like protein [Rhizoctonia solani]QRW19685.1 F-box-like protein [Rhizoctonia solani]